MVNNAINEGWQPLGGIHEVIFENKRPEWNKSIMVMHRSQAMVKYEGAAAAVVVTEKSSFDVILASAAQQAFAPASAAAAPEAKSTDNLLTIKSPMIGTFYRKAAPSNPNLVDEGDEVRSDTPVCIIEAMKLFNEIESEISGRIVKVLVEDSTPVEYDQPLFLVEPA